MAESTLARAQQLVDQLTPHDQVRLLAYLATRLAQVVTALPPTTEGTPSKPADIWETSLRLGTCWRPRTPQSARRSPRRCWRCAGDAMYTVDASVWVNGFDQREAGHATSRQLLQVLRTRALPIILPNLVLAEVAGAISRTRHDPLRAEAFATTLGQLPNVTVVALEVALGHQARAMAAQQYGLRGADAVYAAVVQQAGCTLISLDYEHLTRLGSIVIVRTPAAALADLVPPTPPSSAV
jgi:predicted nucleic acid-binding protein